MKHKTKAIKNFEINPTKTETKHFDETRIEVNYEFFNQETEPAVIDYQRIIKIIEC